MAESLQNRIDAVKELRLRRWARRNYVMPSQRIKTWHPIVLEEMQTRDQELAAQQSLPGLGSTYVPLMPASIRVLHQGHSGCSDPKMLKHLAETEQLRYAAARAR